MPSQGSRTTKRTQPDRDDRSFAVLGAKAQAAALEPGLHIVATPIGNLGDVTLRALATLAGADAILAEDTRVSRRLLDHYEIGTPMILYHEHNAAQARPAILRRLSDGQTLALISDAGTPLISDPGFRLVAEAAALGITIRSLPGPCAAVAALTIAGLPTDRFFFEGFLPAKSAARRARLNAIARIPSTLVIYEAPSRLSESLSDLAAELGSRPAVVARELTKLHEEARRGDLQELATYYSGIDAPKGEIVILVGPPTAEAVPMGEDLDREIVAALANLSVKDAANAVAARTGLPRRDVYARALRLGSPRK